MSSVMLRKSVALRVGGFDTSLKYCLDADLWQRMAIEGEVAFIDEVLLSNRMHAGQATSKILTNGVQMLEERLRYAEATRKLVKEHGANLDWQLDRLLSVKVTSLESAVDSLRALRWSTP